MSASDPKRTVRRVALVSGDLMRGKRAQTVIVVKLRVDLPVRPEGTKQVDQFDVVDNA